MKNYHELEIKLKKYIYVYKTLEYKKENFGKNESSN